MKFSITSGTSIVASASAIFVVAACHSSPVPNGFVATATDKTTENRLARIETMPHLQTYDELFYAPPPDAAAAP